MAETYRRSKLETYIDVLKVISAGAEKPTHIMYRANLSWSVLQGALDLLLNRAFIRETVEDEKKTYSLTEKGYRVINYFADIKRELLGEETIRF